MTLTPAGRKHLSFFDNHRVAFYIRRVDVAQRLLADGYITEEIYELPTGYFPRVHVYHRITDAGRRALQESPPPT